MTRLELFYTPPSAEMVSAPALFIFAADNPELAAGLLIGPIVFSAMCSWDGSNFAGGM